MAEVPAGGGDGDVDGADAGRGGGGDRGGAVRRVNAVAAVVPNFTAVAPVRLVPVMVTEVPPAAGPEVGLTR